MPTSQEFLIINSFNHLSITSESSPTADSNTIFPFDIIDEIIAIVFKDDPDDKSLFQTFKSFSLIIKTFRSTALYHIPANFFATQRFYTAERLEEYTSLVKECPWSIIPSRITTLEIYLGHKHQNANDAFIAWTEYFPNVKHLDFILAADPNPPRKRKRNPVTEVNEVHAIRGIIASPRLQKLTLSGVQVPANYFRNAGPALKTFEISSVQASSDGPPSFPKGLETLRLGDFSGLVLAYQASDTDNGVFESIQELSIDCCKNNNSSLGRDSWGLLNKMKALQRLDLASGNPVDNSLYPLDITKLPKLEILTVIMHMNTAATDYIPWMSEVFGSWNSINFDERKFTLRMRVQDDQSELAIFDQWIAEVIPATMKFELIVQVYAGSCEGAYEANWRNCKSRDMVTYDVVLDKN